MTTESLADERALKFETTLSERVSKLREMMVGTQAACSRRMRLWTESYKTTEGMSQYMRQAEAFKHMLEHMPLVLEPGNLIVGNYTLSPRKTAVFLEYSVDWIDRELDKIEDRISTLIPEAGKLYSYVITDEERQELRE